MKNISLYVEAVRESAFNTSDYNNAYVLVANTAQTVTVPSDVQYVSFAATGNFYVSFTTTAVVPTVTDETGGVPELNPTIRRISGLGSFSVVSDSTPTVIVSFYNA